jgi:hypothetical protein
LMKYNSCIQFCMIVRNLLVWLWPRTKKKRKKSKKIIKNYNSFIQFYMIGKKPKKLI